MPKYGRRIQWCFLETGHKPDSRKNQIGELEICREGPRDYSSWFTLHVSSCTSISLFFLDIPSFFAKQFSGNQPIWEVWIMASAVLEIFKIWPLGGKKRCAHIFI